MLAGVQAGVRAGSGSKHIENKYTLKIECSYDGCTCCSNVPDASMPLNIVPIIDPACCGFIAPGGWMPQNLGFFEINFALC